MSTCINCGKEVAVIGEFCLTCYENIFDKPENKPNLFSDKTTFNNNNERSVFSTNNIDEFE